jgi:hypothetical protein
LYATERTICRKSAIDEAANDVQRDGERTPGRRLRGQCFHLWRGNTFAHCVSGSIDLVIARPTSGRAKRRLGLRHATGLFRNGCLNGRRSDAFRRKLERALFEGPARKAVRLRGCNLRENTLCNVSRKHLAKPVGRSASRCG